MNFIGRQPYSITQKWILDHSDNLSDQIRMNIINFFVNKMPSSTCNRSYLKMWTTYNDCKNIIKGNGFTRRFVKMWDKNLQYSESIYLAYIANNYLPVKEEHTLTNDQYALSILINFIGRSSIRNGKDIYIYLPSLRMRRILKEWIKTSTSK